MEYLKKNLKRISKVFAYVFLGILVSLSLYTFILTDILKKDYVNIFGYSYFVVSSGSMSGTIEVNDIIFVKITSNIKENDIVTFIDSDKNIITHRVIKIIGSKYITQGDANNTLDEPVDEKNLIGKVVLIVSPSFIIKTIAILIILFIFISLLNFDKIFKKFILKKYEYDIDSISDEGMVNNTKKSQPAPAKNNLSLKEDLNKKNNFFESNKLKLLNAKNELQKELDKKLHVEKKLIKELNQNKKKTDIFYTTDNKSLKTENVSSNDELSLLISKKIDEKLDAYNGLFKNNVVVPDEIFTSKSVENDNIEKPSGLTVNIPLEEIEKIREMADAIVDDDDGPMEEFLDFDIKNLYMKSSCKERDNEICELVINFLRIKNDELTTTKLNKKWLIKFQYIYKLCYILTKDTTSFSYISENEATNLLVEEVMHPSFGEIYDYDFGLSEKFKNKIYDMPIYIFLKILTYAVIYNDEEFFDGIFKIMKYKMQFDIGGNFKAIKSDDKYSRQQLNSLVDFMKKVSSDYDNKNVFELKKIERNVDLRLITGK